MGFFVVFSFLSLVFINILLVNTRGNMNMKIIIYEKYIT